MRNPLKSELDKLKKLTFKQKVTYILDYYKFPFLIAAIIIFIFGGLLYTILSYDEDKVTISLAVFDGLCEDVGAASEIVNQAFDQYVGAVNSTGDTILLDTSFLNSGALEDDMNQAVTLQQLIGALSTGELNLMVASRDNLLSMASFDYMEDLEKMLPADIYAKLNDMGVLLSCTVPAGVSVDGREYDYVCGIDLSVLPDNLLTQAGYHLPEDIAVGIAVNAPHPELTLKLLELIIEPMITE